MHFNYSVECDHIQTGNLLIIYDIIAIDKIFDYLVLEKLILKKYSYVIL